MITIIQYVWDVLIYALFMIINLIFTTNLRYSYSYYLHFIGGKTEILILTQVAKWVTCTTVVQTQCTVWLWRAFLPLTLLFLEFILSVMISVSYIWPLLGLVTYGSFVFWSPLSSSISQTSSSHSCMWEVPAPFTDPGSFPGVLVGKESAGNAVDARDVSLIAG